MLAFTVSNDLLVGVVCILAIIALLLFILGKR
jgi:hypothetical protein